ncbi:MAG: CoA pyrophosphatase [Acidobacteriota bacterium]|nr:MAG: CoA pyrophosphatase [Acidobacteriota bacterium]
MRIELDDDFRERVHERVKRFERRDIVDDELVRAAVAVTIVGNDDGDAAFIITQRPLTLRRHAGQWALPGGRADEGETITETALREVQEEVGLELDAEGVVGLLDDFQTRSGFIITPVVVWGPERPELHPDPTEVYAAHVVPLAALDAPGVPIIAPSKPGERPLIYFPMPLLGTTIWAPTAAMLFQTREVLLHGRATRVAHFEQPRWAWQ